MAMACATDYAGRAGEMTQGEARLWGKEVAISGFSPFYDGTWSKSVAYNRKTGAGSVTINNYRNKVFAAFSRDGLVDRDGDDIQGRAGSTTIPLSNPLSVSMAHNGFRPMRAAVDLSTPGGQELLRVLLNNTQNMQPITVAAGFNGGMGISAPVYVQVAVNHDALAAGLK